MNWLMTSLSNLDFQSKNHLIRSLKLMNALQNNRSLGLKVHCFRIIASWIQVGEACSLSKKKKIDPTLPTLFRSSKFNSLKYLCSVKTQSSMKSWTVPKMTSLVLLVVLNLTNIVTVMWICRITFNPIASSKARFNSQRLVRFKSTKN